MGRGGRWTEEDTVLALEWQRLRDSTCTGCGQDLFTSLDPDEAGGYDTHEVVCQGCRAKEQRIEELSSKSSKAMHGVRVLVEPAPEDPDI